MSAAGETIVPVVYVAIFGLALAAFTISAIAGGGAGLVLMPLLGIVLPATQVPAALSIGTAASAASRSVVFRRDVRWDIVVWFVPAALPFTVLGAWLLSVIQPLWLEFFLGLFLAANLTTMLRTTVRPIRPAPTRPMLACIGAGAGFLSGFTGAVGVVFNDFYLRCGLSRHGLVATRAANELVLHVLKIGLYAKLGLLGRGAIEVGSLVALAAILSSFVARRLLGLFSESLFRQISHGAVGVAGIAMLATSAPALAATYDVGIRGKWRDGAVEAQLRIGTRLLSVGWKAGSGPEIEHSVVAADLPPSIRREAAGMTKPHGASPRYVVVRDLRGLSYEVTTDGFTRHLVVTD